MISPTIEIEMDTATLGSSDHLPGTRTDGDVSELEFLAGLPVSEVTKAASQALGIVYGEGASMSFELALEETGILDRETVNPERSFEQIRKITRNLVEWGTPEDPLLLDASSKRSEYKSARMFLKIVTAAEEQD